MKKKKLMGIWMDHSNAILMELTNDTILQSTLISDVPDAIKAEKFIGHEKLIHKKEQHLQSAYYKKLSEAIRKFKEVILFGPTDAKNELINLLRNDHLFEDIKIEVLQSDKMTENQMHDFVREYFR